MNMRIIIREFIIKAECAVIEIIIIMAVIIIVIPELIS